MKLLDLTLDTPAENVALDEALLQAAEENQIPGGVLRLWESDRPMVVLGRSSQYAEEAHIDYCRAEGIPIIRRTSGGASIVTGPGCLMYAVVLSYETYPAARMIDEAHSAVLTPLSEALARLEPRTRRLGISDMVIDQHKFSGNSLRSRRTHFLYHGTLLYDFPLAMIGKTLAAAPRQPQYREGRDHNEFVVNFPASAAELRQALIETWPIDGVLTEWPSVRCKLLASEKYTTDAWNLSR